MYLFLHESLNQVIAGIAAVWVVLELCTFLAGLKGLGIAVPCFACRGWCRGGVGGRRRDLRGQFPLVSIVLFARDVPEDVAVELGVANGQFGL